MVSPRLRLRKLMKAEVEQEGLRIETEHERSDGMVGIVKTALRGVGYG